MSHLVAPHWVDTLGLVAGALGVSIAIWLQMITPRKVPLRYIFAFLVLGSTLMLVNLEPLLKGETAQWAVMLRALAYAILIVAQSALGYRVWHESKLHPIEDTVEWAQEVVEK